MANSCTDTWDDPRRYIHTPPLRTAGRMRFTEARDRLLYSGRLLGAGRLLQTSHRELLLQTHSLNSSTATRRAHSEFLACGQSGRLFRFESEANDRQRQCFGHDCVCHKYETIRLALQQRIRHQNGSGPSRECRRICSEEKPRPGARCSFSPPPMTSSVPSSNRHRHYTGHGHCTAAISSFYLAKHSCIYAFHNEMLPESYGHRNVVRPWFIRPEARRTS